MRRGDTDQARRASGFFLVTVRLNSGASHCNRKSALNPLSARAAVRSLAASKIRELYNEGLGRSDVLGFWVGEPDEPTPQFIRDAATQSIAAGELFYTHNLGIPQLRAALGAYTSRLHRPTDPEQIAVTSAGVNALMLASQLLVDPGDRVVEVVPLWPNLQEIPKILGAEVVTVALEFSPSGWTLDVEKLMAELTPGTRALYLNSPNNPTGWTISRDEQRAILAHCRRHGIWIFADDAYERLYFGAGGVAPSFLDIMGSDDRVISTNTFSKSWLMTGWRLGWLVVPPSLVADLGKLIEYNTSCTPIFVQRAGIAAVTQGEPVIAHTLERLKRARDYLVAELRKLPQVEVAVPEGTMYAFFRIAGMTDSLAFCKQLVRERGLGLAPGAAFGPAGEGYVRWCFAAETARLADGVTRLARALSQKS
jgi:aspartate/methionine/tyrosine aminotransferase